MNIILLSRRNGASRSRYLDLAHPLSLTVVAAVAVLTLGAAFMMGMRLGGHGMVPGGMDSGRFRHMIAEQQAEIAQMKARLQERANAFATRLGEIDAHMLRIDALGRHLTSLAKVDRREFDFDDPAKGDASHAVARAAGGAQAAGVQAVSGQAVAVVSTQAHTQTVDQAAGQAVGQTGGQAVGKITDISNALDDLEQRVELRNAQLSALENAINEHTIADAVRPSGSPVVGSVITSHFGDRTDPLTGEEGHFHKGLDLAGAKGDAVEAVAAGVVTQASQVSDYGNLVEINHGNGYVTRYGHNAKILVKVGDSVVRGQQIALMGSTGRSTGTHVHFEVLRNGQPVNPESFVKSDPIRQVAAR